MALTENTFLGDGYATLFPFTFEYVLPADVRAEIDGADTTEYVLANPTTVEFNIAPPVGSIVTIYRQTSTDAVPTTFYSGSTITAQGLNDNFNQTLYVAQEVQRAQEEAISSNDLSNEAITVANEALSESSIAKAGANQAASDAQQARLDATAAAADAVQAQQSATAAQQSADDAVGLANNATQEIQAATNAAALATQAANNAVNATAAIEQTALDASADAALATSTANAIDGKAQTALDTANAASDVADLAVQKAGDNMTGNLTLGTDKITLDASTGAAEFAGKVGIGTTSPNSLLSLASSAPRVEITDTDTNGRFLIDCESGAGSVNMRVDQDNVVASSAFLVSIDGSERARITSDGNVGIGTDNPTYPLTVKETTPEGITSKFSQGTDPNFELVTANGTALNSNGQEVSRFGINYIGEGWNSYLSFLRGTGATSGSIAFSTSQQEAFRVDSEGRLLVGTSSELAVDNVTAGLQVHGTATTNGASLSIARFRDDISPPLFTFGKSRNSTIAPGTIVQNGDELGRIVFNGDDGTDLGTPAARIQAHVDYPPAANQMPGRLSFSTTAIGAGSPVEHLRITSGGSLRIHQTTSNTPGFNNTTTGSAIEKNSSGSILFVSRSDNASGFFNRNGDGSLLRFFRSGTQVGSIDVTTSTTALVGTSDYRLKENVTDLSNAIDRLKLLTPCRFNFISEPDRTIDGFIAHEMQAAVPEAVFGEKDAVEDQEFEVTPAVLDEDGNVITEAVVETRSVISPQGVDQTKLIPLLTKALQEVVAKNEELTARVEDLERELYA